MSEIRGIILQSRFEYLEEKIGHQAIKKLLEKLSPASKQIIEEQIFPVNKYPFQLLKDIDEVIPQIISEPLEKIFRDIGTNYSPKIVDKYFYNFIESQNPGGFLCHIEKLYFYLWDFGQYDCTSVGNNPNSFQIDLEYEIDIHKPYCWFMQELLKRGTEICGASSPALSELKCAAENADKCLYQIKWEG